MAIGELSTAIEHIRRAALVSDGTSLQDSQLLSLFVERRDQTAFEVLLRRHGPMVLGVCRRFLQNHHDAEDAFQATFLVLARRAASIVPREMVANWLYGVAYRTSLKAKAASARRAAWEKQLPAMPDPEATQPDHSWSDLRSVLDQELSRLSDKYRLPIILCDFESKSIKEAARNLGWPQGTLAGRLARGRAQLAKRLARRGLAVSAASLAVVLGQEVSATTPTGLVSSTIKAAALHAAGQAVTEAVISARAAALTEGVLRTMSLTKLKMLTTVLTIAAGLGGVGFFYRTQAAQPVSEVPLPPTAQSGRDETPIDRAEPKSMPLADLISYQASLCPRGHLSAFGTRAKSSCALCIKFTMSQLRCFSKARRKRITKKLKR